MTATVVKDLPRKLRELETVWIPMSDGVRLAARIWLPDDAERDPVPAILEYIPYRRRDRTRLGDDQTHPYWAGHGYACVRLDMRGSGDSEGITHDEYLKQEQDDAVEAIAWLASRPWCSGTVGMFGISWGGFNALQVAARRPPALKAIIPVAFTDDRYADDMHYMGGALLNDNLNWGSQFFAIMGEPPDPLVAGDTWRTQWQERLEAVVPYFETWLRHPFRDAFWKHGSVCEDYGSITAATLAIGGWADGYSNAVFRVLAGLTCPRQAIVGPWGHVYPHLGIPGPAIDFLGEGLRWWDHWLKGRDTGIMREPMLRVFIQDSVPPRTHYDERPGRWASEDAWPSPRIEARRFALNHDGLAATPGAKKALAIRSPQTAGLASGDWCASGLDQFAPELPGDQREDDGKSLVFDSAPLTETLEILGPPTAELELASDVAVANLCVRLSDVAPDGAATRVSYGVLNLTHRDGHERPKRLVPGRRTKVRLVLNDIAHRFAPGHRLRVAISTNYWPIVWPAPTPATITLTTGISAFVLPVRPARSDDVRFKPAVRSEGEGKTQVRPAVFARTAATDLATGLTTYVVERDDGAWRIAATGVEVGFRKSTRYTIGELDPGTARHDIEFDLTFAHDRWRPRILANTAMSATPTHFIVEADLQAFDGTERVFSRTWTRRVPRKLV
ncbi:MAG: CocE/NonD family hydrolase [Alphaproteobacteria bacterium]|nr:CocE/NonD family hydrolase [Alphaproteobacteria bacterium]